MKDLLLPLLHLAVTAAKLCRPGGVRAVIAENLLLKQQLIVLRRSRQRAPNLRVGDRLLCGFGALVLSPGRIRKVAIGRRPSTVLTFHQALVRGKYRRLFSSSARPKKPGPKGPSESLIRAIVELKSRNPRFGCPRIARIISQTFGVDIDKNVVHRVLAKRSRPAPGGTGPSWLSFVGHTTDSLWSVDLLRVRPSCSRATGCSWSWTSSRGASWDSVCIADRSMHPASAACSTPPFMGGARRDISVRIMIVVRGASVDREPSASGDRRNQDGAPCAPVTPLCGTADRDDAARMPGSCVVLECR